MCEIIVRHTYIEHEIHEHTLNTHMHARFSCSFQAERQLQLSLARQRKENGGGGKRKGGAGGGGGRAVAHGGGEGASKRSRTGHVSGGGEESGCGGSGPYGYYESNP